MKDLGISFFYFIRNRKMGMDITRFPINSYNFDDITFLSCKNDKYNRDKMEILFDKIKNDKEYIYHVEYDGLYGTGFNNMIYHVEYDAVKDRKRKLENILNMSN